MVNNPGVGLTQEKVFLEGGISPWSCRSQASKWCLFSFSTVSVSSPVASSLGAVGPHAAAVSGAAIFHEECRQDQEFRNRILGLERLLRVKAAIPGTETVPVSKVSGAVPGVSCAPPVRCFRGVRNLEKPEVTESELAATSLVGDDAFAKKCAYGRWYGWRMLGAWSPRLDCACVACGGGHFANNIHDLADCLKGACSALGDRPARAAAGESSGMIGLHEGL